MSGVSHILPFSLIIAQLSYSVTKLFYRKTCEDFSFCSPHIKTLSVSNTETCEEKFDILSYDFRPYFVWKCIFNKVQVLQKTFYHETSDTGKPFLWPTVCRHISNNTDKSNPF